MNEKNIYDIYSEFEDYVENNLSDTRKKELKEQLENLSSIDKEYLRKSACTNKSRLGNLIEDKLFVDNQVILLVERVYIDMLLDKED